MEESLVREHLVDQATLLQSETDYLNAIGSMPSLQAKTRSLVANRDELVHQVAATRDAFTAQLLKEIDDARAQVADLNEQMKAGADKARQNTLTAPVDGTVENVGAHTVGGVVTSGERIAEVVPEGARLVVDCLLKNEDVGFVRVGQSAQVKLAAYSFTRFGTLPGKVLRISRDTLAAGQLPQAPANGSELGEGDQDQASHDQADRGTQYLVRIALSSDRIQAYGKPQPLRDGISVTAEIRTGKRRVISYLLSPLARSLNDSISER